VITYIIDDLDQNYLNSSLEAMRIKKIAVEVKTPSSTIQRRLRKIFENQYFNRKMS
jgi:hypothetical protein